MRRNAFTLMELLVSVSLLMLITIFMYSAIGSTKISNKVLARQAEEEQNRTMVFNLLYRDLFESFSIETILTKDKHYTLIEMQTHNTLHDITAPYVTYFVNSQSKKLIRLEAARKIVLPVKYEEKFAIHADVILAKVNDFNLYKSLDDANITAPSNAFANNEAPDSDDESLSSADDVNTTADQESSGSHGYLLYLNSDTLSKPLLLELSI